MIVKIGNKEVQLTDYLSANQIQKALYEVYQQGRSDAKKEINEIMDMDVPISNILYEIDKWIKEQK